MEKTANKQKMHGGKIALYIIAILWTVVTLFPVVVTVMASFKTNSEIYLNLLSFPKKIMFQNYISACIEYHQELPGCSDSDNCI